MKDFFRWFSLRGISVRYFIFLAGRHWKQQRYDEALVSWDKAIQKMPDHYSLWYGRGMTRLMLNDPDAAIRDFSQSILCRAGFAPSHSGLGHALYLKAEYQKSLDALNTSLGLSDSDPMTLLYRAKTRAALGDPKGALNDFNKSLRLDPENSQAYYYRGKLKLELEDARGALLDFNSTVKLDPSFQPAYIERGNAKLKLGSQSGAESDWKKAKKLNQKVKKAEAGL